MRPRVSNHGRTRGAARAASFETAAQRARPPQDEELARNQSKSLSQSTTRRIRLSECGDRDKKFLRRIPRRIA